MKLLIKNARLEIGYDYLGDSVVGTKTAIKDVLIERGIFVEITDQLEVADIDTIDAKGQLLLPSLREMHVHLDKTFFGGDWSAPTMPVNGIFTRISEENDMLPDLFATAEEHTRYMIEHYIANGHTHIRTHVNVDPTMKTSHVEKTKRILDEYQDKITYEIVAFPQHGLLRNGEEFLSVFEESLKMGVTHIGGVDPATIDHNINGVLEQTFDWAEKYGLAIDIHLHDGDTLGSFEIHRIIDQIEERNFLGKVTISHAFALAGISRVELADLVSRMAKNNVDVASSIAIGASAAITLPIRYLYETGVPVSLGHDSLIDHWSPFGTGDTIQKLNMTAKRFNWIDEWHLGQSLKFATGGITPLNEEGQQVWPRINDAANLILVDAVSSAHLIARQCPISTVLSKGAIIYQDNFELRGGYRG